MSEIHVLELLPAYALGCLEQDEAVRVAEHLSLCPMCSAELAAYEKTVDQLSLAVSEASPPAALKQRLMKQIRPASASPAWWQSLLGLFRRSAPAWGAISLVLVVALVTSNVLLWQQANRAEQPGGMQVFALHNTNAAPNATGIIIMSPDGEYGTIVVDGLPELDESQQYQLWLIRDGQRTSGGVFTVEHGGYGAMEIYAPEPLSIYSAFGITVEPAGGSPGPTGPQVLGSEL